MESHHELSPKKTGMNILAIGPHPDDIEFGCGGTLVRYGQAGNQIYQLILTDGCVGGDPATRKLEQEGAAAALGVKKIIWGGYHDTELHDDRNLIRTIEGAVTAVSPDIVLINHFDDSHQDHRAASRATIAATRNVKEVLCYESPSCLDFIPDIFVDITDILPEKIKLLELHASQIEKTSIENLKITEIARAYATFRGVQGRVHYAEGFRGLRVLRNINDRMCL